MPFKGVVQWDDAMSTIHEWFLLSLIIHTYCAFAGYAC